MKYVNWSTCVLLVLTHVCMLDCVTARMCVSIFVRKRSVCSLLYSTLLCCVRRPVCVCVYISVCNNHVCIDIYIVILLLYSFMCVLYLIVYNVRMFLNQSLFAVVCYVVCLNALVVSVYLAIYLVAYECALINIYVRLCNGRMCVPDWVKMNLCFCMFICKPLSLST